MPHYYMDQGGGTAVFLAPEFPDPASADAFANSIGVFGTPVEQSAWESSVTVLAAQLGVAKFEKLAQLKAEGDRRSLLVNLAFRDVIAGYALGVAVKNNSLENEGKDWRDVGDAWAAAVATIVAFTDINDVINYDVVNDPSWP